jgi:hypothetical protein
VQLNSPNHGCEACRGHEWRTGLTRELLGKGELGDYNVKCLVCGVNWKVSLFPVGIEQEIHVAFNPIATEPLN